MKQSPKTSGKNADGSKSDANLLFNTILDTTWRVFVPTIGGTFIGVGVDKLLNIAPLATMLFILGGFAVSGILIAMQLKSVRK